jgi:hypothetical protein
VIEANNTKCMCTTGETCQIFFGLPNYCNNSSFRLHLLEHLLVRKMADILGNGDWVTGYLILLCL